MGVAGQQLRSVMLRRRVDDGIGGGQLVRAVQVCHKQRNGGASTLPSIAILAVAITVLAPALGDARQLGKFGNRHHENTVALGDEHELLTGAPTVATPFAVRRVASPTTTRPGRRASTPLSRVPARG